MSIPVFAFMERASWKVQNSTSDSWLCRLKHFKGHAQMNYTTPAQMNHTILWSSDECVKFCSPLTSVGAVYVCVCLRVKSHKNCHLLGPICPNSCVTGVAPARERDRVGPGFLLLFLSHLQPPGQSPHTIILYFAEGLGKRPDCSIPF